MFTSVTDRQRFRGLCYLAAAVLTAAAGAVYEYFSHGVYSNYMIFAFLIPLLAGAVPNIIAAAAGNKKRADRGGSAASALQLAGGVTLTAGSLLKGALEIYGTTNRLTAVYPVVGTALLAAALAAYVLQERRLSAEPSAQGQI